jgi:polysaccharide biosynthesis/export protein
MWGKGLKRQWPPAFLAALGAGLFAHVQPTTCQEPPPSASIPTTRPSTYTLGPNDEISLSGTDADELVNKPFRIDPEGDISLPMVGRLHAAGLTVRQFEKLLNERLSTFVRDPHVVVTTMEVRSQPVSVLGAVKSPGTYQLQGRKTLAEIIALAGGFREDAGYVVKITREMEWGAVPLPNATVDSSNHFSLAEVSISKILEGQSPAENILIMPHDVISVPKGELVYVIGDVKKAGGFILSEREHISVLQALSMAEGTEPTADSQHAKILRLQPGHEQRQEIVVNVKKILAGSSLDVPMQPGDILFLPTSTAKKVGIRTVDAAIQAAVGIAIWRP